jgi:hypothetical protein
MYRIEYTAIAQERKSAMLERVRRCPYCGRESSVTATSYAANPFCNACLPDRIEQAKKALGPVKNIRDGAYLIAVPATRKQS